MFFYFLIKLTPWLSTIGGGIINTEKTSSCLIPILLNYFHLFYDIGAKCRIVAITFTWFYKFIHLFDWDIPKKESLENKDINLFINLKTDERNGI